MRSTTRAAGAPTSSEFPFIADRADPQLFRYGGRWHFLATDDHNGDNEHSPHLLLRVSDTIDGLRTTPDIELLRAGDAGLTGGFWAPEAHVLGARLHILFSPSVDGAGWSAIQAHLMALRPGGDPAEREDWEPPVRIRQHDGEPLQRSGQGIALDLTPLVVGEDHYFVWSQRRVAPTVGRADIWIAPVDPLEPERLAGEPSRILAPEFAWESTTLEGPWALVRDDRVHLVYAAADVGPHYATGIATASADADLLDPASWSRRAAPALDSTTVPGEWGPGHVSFTEMDGELWMAYHAMSGRSPGPRHAGLRRVRFSDAGELDLRPLHPAGAL